MLQISMSEKMPKSAEVVYSHKENEKSLSIY